MFGTRYCTGGYIFQIEDAKLGPMLSGPTFPDEFDPFHGQGIPDAFSRMPLRDRNDPFRAIIMGIGFVDLRTDTVIEFCEWDLELDDTLASFATHQRFAGYDLSLKREVRLADRTVISTNSVHNAGAISFPIAWYSHPFFPQPVGDELLSFNIPVSLRPNDGYELSTDGFIVRKGWPWETDYFLPLDHDASAPLVVMQRHPKIGSVQVRYSYVPGYFPIWGNEITFSFEPYYERHIGAGQTLEWKVEYQMMDS